MSLKSVYDLVYPGRNCNVGEILRNWLFRAIGNKKRLDLHGKSKPWIDVLLLFRMFLFPQNYKMDDSIDRCYKLLQEPISIEQCLKDFTKEEELGDDETW